MKVPSHNKFISIFRLFKYLDFKNILFFIKQKIHGNIAIASTLKDGTKTELMSAFFLAVLRCRRECINEEQTIYDWQIEEKKWRASYHQIVGLEEYINNDFTVFYKSDIANKIILDIGGFIGDSAYYFLKNNAKKIIIYEPSACNIQAMEHNLKDHKSKIEIHQKAVSEKDGIITLESSFIEGSNMFGLGGGYNKVICHGISFESLLKQHCCDIAKIDCEGAERFLLNQESTLLKKIPYWMIETHDEDLYNLIVNKFQSSEFTKIKEFKIDKKTHVVHFHLRNFP